MISVRQQAYLKAMEIPVWVARGMDEQTARTHAGIRLGPGKGQILSLCEHVDDSSLPLAADIARCLAHEPVWGWTDASPDAAEPDAAVNEGLFTHVLVFGQQTEQLVFGGPAPEMLGSAVILRAPSMKELAGSAAHRRTLWQLLTRNRLAGPRTLPATA